MTDHPQASTPPRPPAFPRARKSGTRRSAARRGLRLAAVTAPLGLLLAVTAGAGLAPAQAASKTGRLFAGHEAPARGAAPAPACASRTGTGWKRVPTLDPGNFDRLNGVAAVSSCQAWAVGGYSGGTLIESWDGTAWAQQPSPSPGRDGNGLNGVAATSATDAWAVGSSTTGAVTHTLIEHWDGSAWTQVPSPNPTAQSSLRAVTASSPTDAWAVGNYAAGAVTHTLIEHWNGTTWKQVPSPESSDGGVLSGVDAISATSAWAVGTSGGNTLILQWNGTAWKQVPSPSPGGPNGSTLSGVAATSPASAWAAGDYGAGSISMDKTLILHWNGAKWTKVASPNPSSLDNELYGVAATSPANIWAVGIHTNLSTFLTLALHCC